MKCVFSTKFFAQYSNCVKQQQEWFNLVCDQASVETDRKTKQIYTCDIW